MTEKSGLRLFVILATVLAVLVGLTMGPRTARAEAQAATETPTIKLQPSCWTAAGVQALTIVGNSFDPSVKVNVFDATGGQASTPATTDEYGTFTAQLNVPTTTAGHEIRVSDANGEKDLARAIFDKCQNGTASAKIAPACSSNAGDSGPQLHMVGTGWATASDAPIEFRLDFGGQSGIAQTSINPPTADFDFVWSPVSADPERPIVWTSGVYTVLVNQKSRSDESVANSAQLTFRIPCPQVSVAPQCAPPGAPPGRLTLTLSGSGFDPAAELNVVFDDAGKPQHFTYDISAPPSPGPSATGASPSPPPPPGTFGPITIDPFRRPAGTYTLEVYQLNSTGIDYDWITTVRFPCYQPRLAAPLPDCGDPVVEGPEQQYAITVSGSDFVPNASITIVFDPDGAAGPGYAATKFPGTTDALGGLYAGIAPIYRPPNTYRILAYQDTSFGHLEASTTFTVPCGGPSVSPPPSLPPGAAFISVNATCAPAADGQAGAYPLRLTGGGFAPGPVTVVLDPAGEPFTGTVEADVNGYVSGPFPAEGKVNGRYQLRATQEINGTHIEATATLTVPCQTLTVDPACKEAADGRAGAYAITAKGLGFDSGPVDLVFDPNGVAPARTQAQADSSGAFAKPLLLTGKPEGVYDLVASQKTSYGLYSQATAQLLVPCGAVVLRITPTSGPQGFVPTVEGFGFPANTDLTLKWDFGISAGQTVPVKTDGLGNFSRQMLVFQHDFLGLRHVTAQRSTDPEPLTTKTATYLVAAAAFQPPFSADDGVIAPPEPVLLQR